VASQTTGPQPSGIRSRPLDPGAIAVLMPTHREPPEPGLIEGARSRVGRMLIVDDGSAAPWARLLELRAAGCGVELLRLGRSLGKGSAIRAGLDLLRAGPSAPAGVIVVDADGQHPPDAIPRLIAASAGADLVIGDRLGDRAAMPWDRRWANLAASGLLALATRRPVRDSQCGMRLLARSALWEVPFPPGRFEAETLHLKRCLRQGVEVAWVPLPALYAGRVSSFRKVADSLAVLGALARR
jgi:glycosyltransferase involved in cell wall biosynthesis